MSAGSRRVLVWFTTLAAGYAVIVLAVYIFQAQLLFPGAGNGRGQPVPWVQGVRVEQLAGATGEAFRVAVGQSAGRPPRAVLLFFLGNGEDLRSGVVWAGDLTGYDVATVVPEYPGYGDSSGEPSFEALMANAAVAHEFAAGLAAQHEVPLLVGGSSLGTFSAVHVAALGGVDRLVLLAPPTSIIEAGSQRYPWLPVRWLIRHPFDNLAAADKVECPALVLHGDADTVVPMEMGRRVARALNAEFIVAPGARHTGEPLASGGPFGARVKAFLLGSR